MTTMGVFINGEWRESNRKFSVFNPATGELLESIEDADRGAAIQAIEAAHQAFAQWSSITAYERAEVLHKANRLMMSRQAELAELMTCEQGKPLKAAKNEVKYAADFLRWYAEEAVRNYGETIPSARPDQRFITRHQAVGVVGAITPWNYPISMLTRKLAPALAAGCTVVLKPAEATPLCAIEVFKIFIESGLPKGVANLLCCSDPKAIGEEFCRNPKVKKVTFTGSTAVGRSLAKDAAPYLKRFSMELGGHAPFIVFEDADPVHAAKGACLVKFLNTGQACISPNRIFVQRGILDEFIQTFSNRVAKMRVGNGMQPTTNIGPLVNQTAVDKVENQVRDAIDQGAVVHNGGQQLSDGDHANGCFFAPTLLSNVTQDMLIYRQETFGPVAAVIPFDEYQQVIEMANDTNYGLAAYVYTQNLSLAMRAFEALNFGIIGINDINPTSAAAPFGGMNDSGMGREGARAGLSEYLETKLGGFSI